MKKSRVAAALAVAFPLVAPAWAQTTADAPSKSLGIVTITGGQPTSLPTQIPTTMEGVTREQIGQTINATDSEDALKYFPSLLVRKRYIGDYNHAILSSRASGTGNSARSTVYADGILLSNYLGNGVGGPSFPPRWGLVTPEEIERVDVMYGPFSAAYPGTSVGNKAGDWSWFLNFNHTDSHGRTITDDVTRVTWTAKTREEGRNDWVEIPAPGQALSDLKAPAAVLEVLPGGGAAGHNH